MKLSISRKNELIEKINGFIAGLSIAELVFVNKIIVERIKFIQKTTALTEMSKFRIGDIVSFNNGSEFISGRILKFNQKTVSLLTENNEQWNVSPMLLMKKV